MKCEYVRTNYGGPAEIGMNSTTQYDGIKSLRLYSLDKEVLAIGVAKAESEGFRKIGYVFVRNLETATVYEQYLTR